MSEDTTRLLPNDDLKLILAQLQSLTSQVQSLTSQVQYLGTQVAALDDRQASLEEKVDRRLQETRPLWEAVMTRLEKIDARLAHIEEDNKDLRRTFFGMLKQFTRMNDELPEWIEKLEERNAA